jgi:hypothetical protein
MNDTHPEYCTLCPDRERIPHHPLICDACRSWLAAMIGDIRILFEQLATLDPTIRDTRIAPVRGRDGHAVRDPAGALVLRWRDPIGHDTPAAPVRGQYTGPRSASIPDSRPPLPLEPVDLTLPARRASRALFARAALGLDNLQVGSLSVATTLQAWADDWAAARALGEHRPEPTVDVLTRWLTNRLDWACGEYEDLPDFATEMRTYRAALRRALGQGRDEEYKDGVACPKCRQMSLHKPNGRIWIECGTCPNILSPEEYRQLAAEQASHVDAA